MHFVQTISWYCRASYCWTLFLSYYFLFCDYYGQVGSKRKRENDLDEMSSGAARAHQFLKEFSDLPLDKMDFNEALQQVNKLKDELQKDAKNCSWLQKFF